jgi:HK97 family phage major capsid protein
MLELDEERTQAITASSAIVEKTETEDDRALTPEEKTELAGLQRDISRLDAEIAERALKDQLTATVKAQAATLQAERKVAPSDPNTTGEVPKPEVVPFERRYGKLRAFKGPGANSRAFESGKFLQAAIFGDDRADRWCRNHGIDCRALSVGTNTAGGFLVPEAFGTTIIDLRETYGIFRQQCRVVPMSEHTMTVPRRAGGVTATYTGENTALTESDATFNQVTLVARKLGVLTRISTELSEDSIIDIADWCAQEFAWAFAKAEDDAGFKGDGSQTYGSIVGASIAIVDGTHTTGAVDATSGADQFTEIVIGDIEKLVMTLPLYAHPGAKWYMSPLCWATCFERLALAAGGTSATHYTEGLQRTYLGYPVVLTHSLPSVSTELNDEAMFLFGDLALAATLGDRGQITVSLSQDRYFVEDQIGIKATQRYDINVHDLGDTSDAGPIVALVGNT